MTSQASRAHARQSSAPALLLRAREAAATLGISEKTLWLQTQPRGPIPSIRIGGKLVRYSVADLEAFIASQRQSA